MSKDQIKQILSMGYRKADNKQFCKTWAKPFGQTLFVIRELGHTIKMTIHFKGSDNQYCIWSSEEYENSKFSAEHIKDFECTFCKHFFQFSEFQFLSVKEIFENGLE